jgi:two-component system, NtrC family, sensor histidine kinase GlrK
MRLSILARLLISYLIFFSMLAGVSLYFIVHINQFNRMIHSIMLDDTAILELSSQLSDILLSETRNERKYFVLKDEQLYLNYVAAKADFNTLLNNAMAQAPTQQIKHILYTVSMQHHNFNRLVEVEREQIRLARPYSSEWYAEEKKKAADVVIDQIKHIRHAGEQNVLAKIMALSESGDKAARISVMITLAALAAGLIVAVIITGGITRPLYLIRAKTKEISRGNFQGDLAIHSPPNIAELAAAINTMCHKLEQVDTMKRDFFSHMSHELRTPLASIKEGTSMLLDGVGGEISEKQQHILSIINQESNRLINQVNSLLDLSKMEAGMFTYQFSPTDLSELVKKCLAGLVPLAEAKNISLENNIGLLPPVSADRERILQAFRNIIGNAVKFTPDNGRIELRSDIENGQVLIAVQDNGMGISQADLDRIFLKFEQIIPAKGGKIKGTGLGLALVKQIILAHGGKVWATSQEGQGSTFFISLPLAA